MTSRRLRLQWVGASDQQKYTRDQFEYTKTFRAEYQAPLKEEDETKAQQENVHSDPPPPSTPSAPLSCASGSSEDLTQSVYQSKKIGFAATASTQQNKSEATTSMYDFDQTSTVMPPDEFTSSISGDDVRRQYFFNYKPNKSLLIYKYRQNIINSINSYSAVIVEGATGCGKTTQVPMYILEDAIIDRNCAQAPVVYVTQPRRIAARSIANRVCAEHGWILGDLVGYHVGLDKRVSPQTILVFCTAGVLLQKLIHDKSLKNYSHIIIDEAHERDADTDLLLMMIRTLMRSEMSFFRLIIMSATIELHKLKSYFTFKTTYGHRAITPPQVCRVDPGNVPSNIQVYYYDSLRQSFNIDQPMPPFDISVPELYDECLEAAVKIIMEIIPHFETYNEQTHSTLVFLPGLAEITKLHRLLLSRKGADELDIIPLHSCISVMDQYRAFEAPRDRCRKVILATNIAESSITVKDVGFIIDFCLTKVLRKDEVTRFPTLKIEWASQDKCIQRTGRTGRCCPGKVFRMVTTNFYGKFRRFAEPELLTSPLELSVLKVKNFQMGEVQALLAIVLDPPPYDEIRTAVLELKQIGALSSTFNGIISDIDGDLTELGRVISALPIDVHLSKLIVIAQVLDVVEDAIIVAACLSTNRTVVKHLYNNMLESYANKLEWAHGSSSDLFVSLDVYKEYVYEKDERRRNNAYMEAYCHNRSLDERKLQEVSALVHELRARLEGVNIKIYEQPNRVRDKNEDELMLKIAFCASFYPNYFLTQKLDVQDIKKDILGFDPSRTVYISNIPINEVPLYRTLIMDTLQSKIDGFDAEYIADVSRALLRFDSVNSASKDHRVLAAIGDGVVQSSKEVPLAMYLALKMGECESIWIREYKTVEAQDRMQYYREEREKIVAQLPNRLIPTLMKIVRDKPVDNSRLFLEDHQEFVEATKENYFVEIQQNLEQDFKDLSLQAALEDLDSRKSKAGDEDSGDAEAEEEGLAIFKPLYRQVRGPTSPIRMSFRSILMKSRSYNVDLDPLSVNSVLLDPDFEKDRRQMLVAASVNQNRRNRILARDTTLMPNIRGLPTLMALLFAQYYRIVYNEQLQCIEGGIFGLGWYWDDQPLDPQYEVDLSFDVHITWQDIELINKARQIISHLIGFLNIQDAGAPQAQLQYDLRKIILNLIRRRRYPLNEIDFGQVDWSRDGFQKDKHNVPKEHLGALRENETRPFLPVAVMGKDYLEWDLYKSIRDNLTKLDLIERRVEKPPVGGIKCLLCGNGVGYMYLMQSKLVNHLYSDEHVKNLEQFEVFEERARERMNEEVELRSSMGNLAINGSQH